MTWKPQLPLPDGQYNIVRPCALGELCLHATQDQKGRIYASNSYWVFVNGTDEQVRACSPECAHAYATGDIPLARVPIVQLRIKHSFSKGGGRCVACATNTHHAWEYGDMIFRACKDHVAQAIQGVKA